MGGEMVKRLDQFRGYFVLGLSLITVASLVGIFLATDVAVEQRDRRLKVQADLDKERALRARDDKLRAADVVAAEIQAAISQKIDSFQVTVEAPDYVIAPTPDCPSVIIRTVRLHDNADRIGALLQGATDPLGEDNDRPPSDDG